MSVRAAAFAVVVAAAGACAGSAPEADPETDAVASAEPAANGLTAEEEAAGWRLLFDGVSTAGWRAYGGDEFPETGWVVEGGDLVVSPPAEGRRGGDIVTEETFRDFELAFEFLLTPVGNSGVFYRVVEHEGLTMWQVAPEYQVLDDSAYLKLDDFVGATHLTGDNYDLHAAETRVTRPPGQWNRGRILVDGDRVEHWLNGARTVAYTLGSPDWEARVARSKFAPYAPYGRAREGRIGLQDHDHEVRYRSIRIRPLDGG